MEIVTKQEIKPLPDRMEIVDFNKELYKYYFSDILSFKVNAFNRIVEVDLKNQKIHVDGEETPIELTESLKYIKWVSFKRNFISYGVSGGKTYEYKIGVGFQGQDSKGDNIQRFIMVDKEGKATLFKKK